jgi:hypothetical protein
MALVQGEDGRWRDTDDTSNQIGHNSFEDAAAAQQSARGLGGGAGGGTFIDGIMGIGFLAIFFWLPKIIGKLAGFFIGLMFKLGIVGRIIMTALVMIVGLLLIYIAATWLPLHGKVLTIVRALISLIGALGIGLWYWVYHHNTIKHRTIGDIAKSVAFCFSIIFYGSIILGILLWLMIGRTLPYENMAFEFAVILSFAFAIYLWIKDSKAKALS